jgi:hypothetical protein
LEENLASAYLKFTSEELHDLESSVLKIKIQGDWYNAVEQSRVEKLK